MFGKTAAFPRRSVVQSGVRYRFPAGSAVSYDTAWAAKYRPDDLDHALERSTPAKVQSFTGILQSVEIFDHRPGDTKPVISPKWTKWRTEAPEILRTRFTHETAKWRNLQAGRPGTGVGE